MNKFDPLKKYRFNIDFSTPAITDEEAELLHLSVKKASIDFQRKRLKVVFRCFEDSAFFPDHYLVRVPELQINIELLSPEGVPTKKYKLTGLELKKATLDFSYVSNGTLNQTFIFKYAEINESNVGVNV